MVRAMKYLLIAVLALCAFGCKKDGEAAAAAGVDVGAGEVAVDAAQEATAASVDATATAAEDVTAAVAD